MRTKGPQFPGHCAARCILILVRSVFVLITARTRLTRFFDGTVSGSAQDYKAIDHKVLTVKLPQLESVLSRLKMLDAPQDTLFNPSVVSA